MNASELDSAARRAGFVRDHRPPGGLFAGQTWRTALAPFPLSAALAAELETLGRVLLQFNRAANLLYRQSVEGRQPAWVADWLDRGKPASLIARQRDPGFRQDLPRVLRPDILLTEDGMAITELDAVPGGIGLTAWLNEVYSQLPDHTPGNDPAVAAGAEAKPSGGVLGGAFGMHQGFASIFGDAPHVHVIVSEEAATYRPEMQWLVDRLNQLGIGHSEAAVDRNAAPARPRFSVRDPAFTGVEPGDAVYRFFELFDLANVPSADRLFDRAQARTIQLTPPPKPLFEEKLLLALLWNRNLRGFWRQHLGEGFLTRLWSHVPYTWVLDPTPLPPQGAIPELNLTDWQQLKGLSQRERALILKASGFSEHAWGARSVALGSDLSVADWSAAVDQALGSFGRTPYVLQRYHKPGTVETAWYDFGRNQVVLMAGRVRLCPYYFVTGEGDAARARLGGVLATICPAEKKIIHGMSEAILAPCAAVPASSGQGRKRGADAQGEPARQAESKTELGV